MAIAVVASTSIPTTGASSTVPQTSAAIDTSTATLVEVTVFSYAGATAPVLSHSKNDLFVPLTERVSSSSTRVQKHYLICHAGNRGTGHTFTLTPTPFNTAYASAVVRAYSGTRLTFVSEAGGTSASTASLNAGSVTPPANGALITTGLCYNATISGLAISGESLAIIQHISYAAGTTMGGAAADEIQTTAAALNPLWSWTPAVIAAACTATYYESPPGTSYLHVGGTGNRTSIITVTGTGLIDVGAGLVNGTTAAGFNWFSNLTLLRFQFSGFHKIIDEVKFYQQNTTAHGTWKWQGSNDAITWADIGSSFTLGGAATQTITAMAGNTTEYIYYQMVRVSGSTSSGPYVYEFEFKIDNGSVIVTEPVVAQLAIETAIMPPSVSIDIAQMFVETAALQAAAGVVFAQVAMEVAALEPAYGIDVSQMALEVATVDRPGETAIMIFD